MTGYPRGLSGPEATDRAIGPCVVNGHPGGGPREPSYLMGRQRKETVLSAIAKILSVRLVNCRNEVLYLNV